MTVLKKKKKKIGISMGTTEKKNEKVTIRRGGRGTERMDDGENWLFF